MFTIIDQRVNCIPVVINLREAFCSRHHPVSISICIDLYLNLSINEPFPTCGTYILYIKYESFLFVVLDRVSFCDSPGLQ